MSRERTGTLYACRECGAQAFRWEGRCPACGQWNSLIQVPPSRTPHRQDLSWISSDQGVPQQLSRVSIEDFSRVDLASGELNRVLGGGLVRGSLVLLGGDPGIGKSTLLLQICNNLASSQSPVMYVSGEESLQQIKLRAERLCITGEDLHVLAETDMTTVFRYLDILQPVMVVIDSVQSVALPDMSGGPGSLVQVRECALSLLRWSKDNGTPTIITGHVTKEGNLAGPKALEHMVDVVLYMDGDNLGSYRLLRGEKNRFGSTHEVGVFEMREQGLVEVPNPSQVALSSRGSHAVGSAIVPVMEGTRPVLVEVQALTTNSSLPTPRRVANGVDMGRLLMVIAVLTKRTGVPLGSQDIIVNVAGGFRATEPVADLGIALALASSVRNISLHEGIAAIGEIGLGGELRGVGQIARRMGELSQMGFRRCIAPLSDLRFAEAQTGIEVIGAESIGEALSLALPSQV